MSDFFDILFGSGSKPVRRDASVRLRHDADGNPIIEPIDGESFSLSDVGSIDRMKIKPDRFYFCGCDAQNPMGGRCTEPGCANVSCAKCFGRCALCRSALCLEHSRYLTNNEGQTLRLCRRCHDITNRKRILRSVVGRILSPFVSFENKERDD